MDKNNNKNKLDESLFYKKITKSWVEEKIKEGPIHEGKYCLGDEQIIQYANQTLQPLEKEKILEHISKCAHCYIRIEEFWIYKKQLEFSNSFNKEFSNETIKFEDRIENLKYKVLTHASDIEELCNEDHDILINNEYIFIIDKQNLPVTQTINIDSCSINIEINNNKLAIFNNSSIKPELILKNKIINSNKESIKNKHIFNLSLNNGYYYIYPYIFKKQKVISLYIHKLDIDIAVSLIQLLKKILLFFIYKLNTAKEINEKQIIKKHEFFLVQFQLFRIIRNKKMMSTFLTIAILSIIIPSTIFYNSKPPSLPDQINMTYQKAINNNLVFKYDAVSFHWLKKHLQFAQVEMDAPYKQAFGYGLMVGKKQIIHKLNLPKNYTNETEKKVIPAIKDMHNNPYYWFGYWCFILRNVCLSGEVLPKDFWEDQFNILKQIQKALKKLNERPEYPNNYKLLTKIETIIKQLKTSPAENSKYRTIVKEVDMLIKQYAPSHI